MKVIHILGGLSVSVSYKWVEPEVMLMIASACAIGITIQCAVMAHKRLTKRA